MNLIISNLFFCFVWKYQHYYNWINNNMYKNAIFSQKVTQININQWYLWYISVVTSTSLNLWDPAGVETLHVLISSSSSLQDLQQSLLGGGGDAASDVRLAAAALQLPAGREAGVPVRGGAEGGETSHQQQNAQKDPDPDQDQDQRSAQDATEKTRGWRNEMNTPQLTSALVQVLWVDCKSEAEDKQ